MCSIVKKIARIPFPIVVGPYSCASRSDAQNLVKAFENIIKLIDYEVKEVLKASNKKLMNYIRAAIRSTSTSTFGPSIEENNNFLLKLQ